jgi:hypothetical protein
MEENKKKDESRLEDFQCTLWVEEGFSKKVFRRLVGAERAKHSSRNKFNVTGDNVLLIISFNVFHRLTEKFL